MHRRGEPARRLRCRRLVGFGGALRSLAWLLARRDYIVPIPGSRNPSRVEQNIAATQVILTDEELAAIDRAAPEGGVGGRM